MKLKLLLWNVRCEVRLRRKPGPKWPYKVTCATCGKKYMKGHGKKVHKAKCN